MKFQVLCPPILQYSFYCCVCKIYSSLINKHTNFFHPLFLKLFLASVVYSNAPLFPFPNTKSGSINHNIDHYYYETIYYNTCIPLSVMKTVITSSDMQCGIKLMGEPKDFSTAYQLVYSKIKIIQINHWLKN